MWTIWINISISNMSPLADKCFTFIINSLMLSLMSSLFSSRKNCSSYLKIQHSSMVSNLRYSSCHANIMLGSKPYLWSVYCNLDLYYFGLKTCKILKYLQLCLWLWVTISLRLCMWQLLESGVDVGGGRGLVGSVEPSKLTGMRHYLVLTWPKNPEKSHF